MAPPLPLPGRNCTDGQGSGDIRTALTPRTASAFPEDDDERVVDDEQFAQFCDDADRYTPSQAAARLRSYRVPDDVVDALVERYEQHVSKIREVGHPPVIQEGGRVAWYAGPRQSDHCWPKLVDRLNAELGDRESVGAVDQSTSRIVSLLEHPATVEFTTKGLVLGHVQAGKTTNYTGVMAKTADRGYRLFIVLAGIHNELRRQTQNRLISHLISPNRELWHQLTDPDRDFHPIANAPAYFTQYGQWPGPLQR